MIFFCFFAQLFFWRWADFWQKKRKEGKDYCSVSKRYLVFSHLLQWSVKKIFWSFCCLRCLFKILLDKSYRKNTSQKTFILVNTCEDILKTSWRCLQCNIFLSLPRYLEDLLKDVLKMSCEDVLKKYLEDILQTRLEDVLQVSCKMKNCYVEDVFETSSRHLGKQEMFTGLLSEHFDRYLHFVCTLNW